MVDRLDALLARFAVHAEVFHTGALCGINDLPAEDGSGQLHLVRSGGVEVVHGGAVAARVEVPSLLLYPRPLAHRFVTDPARGADFACARLRFDGGAGNPVLAALPAFVCLPLGALAGATPILGVLFEEAFQQYCGRRAVLDRLFEVVLIQVLRHLMEDGQARVGLLAGLAHPRLRHALVAMHEIPARDWSLDALAEVARMSRSSFAAAFRGTVGQTPGGYLQQWRIGLAQQALGEGRPLKVIADEVGYGSEAALSRAFKAQCGLSPRAWRQAREAGSV
ncbi:AraC family transcriptional regulator [Coralloluteibacterium stylophorae]|uniref:AraC family transcriptional regulator n=1 Tax=Coralloluteibacterium stylophorae TaxID=1776034 RepID=A0A8J7VQ51_9GAMM|nr:AraC family transcriptional regulator [Coralloluteibacterium stylophorae]MBS7457306.1 AraC family transcriptional regulator [Coralloluteibacterium stylophorae]